jgi:hypothetical protein
MVKVFGASRLASYVFLVFSSMKIEVFCIKTALV